MVDQVVPHGVPVGASSGIMHVHAMPGTKAHLIVFNERIGCRKIHTVGIEALAVDCTSAHVMNIVVLNSQLIVTNTGTHAEGVAAAVIISTELHLGIENREPDCADRVEVDDAAHARAIGHEAIHGPVVLVLEGEDVAATTEALTHASRPWAYSCSPVVF